LLAGVRIRPPYGGHPRVFIWGLLEARLQQADLMVLGGLNEGVWPALPASDPWLAPRIRSNLGLPNLEFRVGLSAHDFASVLGAPQALITRARRDSRSPTIASRLWLRLQAMTGGLVRDTRLERLALVLDDPGTPKPVDRPAPKPPREQRPTKISVTSVDRLKADPFAFYAQAVLGLRRLDPVDADHSAAWKGTAVHEILETWLRDDDCDPAKLVARARSLLASETIHPMLRAVWQPRLMEAGGFEGISGHARAHEYWSLSKYGDQFGKCVCPDKKMGPDEFLDHARRNFSEAARKWLVGDEPFTAKLNPAYAPYGDYDQLMRLEEWYGRR
jgi:ATP-dependent helicase/nuclease subunit B